MSSPQPSLYGAYPWADGSASSPTLYAEGFAPETFMVPLSDSITEADSDVLSANKPLSDSTALSESLVKTVMRSFSESTTMTDAMAKTIRKVLSESSGVTDNGIVVMTTKTLSDFILVKEWISINLQKEIFWVNMAANRNIFDSLYGRYLYGRVPFGGVKPLSTWTAGSMRQVAWTNANGFKYNE